jgi:acetate kinase
MRRLRAESNPTAQKAIAMFTHRVVRESGALIACLGGLDVLAFSGGIGEHDAVLRADVCAKLAYLGVQIDPALNAVAVGDAVMAVHLPHSTVEVWVVPTDEGRVAARDAARLTAQV